MSWPHAAPWPHEIPHNSRHLALSGHAEQTLATGQHGGGNHLSKILPKIWHLDLTNYVKHDIGVMSANGGYCDIFLGHVEAAHLQYNRSRWLPSDVVQVAIKRLRIRLGREKGFTKTLAREIAVWARLEHVNILPFLGYMIENGYPSLVSEWINDGTLRDYIRRVPDCDILRMAIGIAKGVEYLHQHDIVHSDLKAVSYKIASGRRGGIEHMPGISSKDNVLISQTGEPLICDFGISRMLDSSHTLFVSTTHNGGEAKGSTRWMAKELHITADGNDPKHSKETDIWAYGMTLYEMISKEVPYSHLRQDLHVMLAVMRGELPTCTSSIETQATYMSLWSVCNECWKMRPVDRPIIRQIVSRLQQLYRSPQLEASSSSTNRSMVPISNLKRKLDDMLTPSMTDVEQQLLIKRKMRMNRLSLSTSLGTGTSAGENAQLVGPLSPYARSSPFTHSPDTHSPATSIGSGGGLSGYSGAGAYGYDGSGGTFVADMNGGSYLYPPMPDPLWLSNHHSSSNSTQQQQQPHSAYPHSPADTSAHGNMWGRVSRPTSPSLPSPKITKLPPPSSSHEARPFGSAGGLNLILGSGASSGIETRSSNSKELFNPAPPYASERRERARSMTPSNTSTSSELPFLPTDWTFPPRNQQSHQHQRSGSASLSPSMRPTRSLDGSGVSDSDGLITLPPITSFPYVFGSGGGSGSPSPRDMSPLSVVSGFWSER